MTHSPSFTWLHRYAILTTIATFILLIAGGLVTSTDSGLAVPDWPLSYGTLFPPMIGGIRFEHPHRVIAALVGLMIAVLAGWLWRAEPRRWVRRIGYAAFGAVILQALLGGLTVLWLLPPPVSVAHACLGQLVWCLVVTIALATSPQWLRRTAWLTDPSVRRASLLATALIFAQLVLGAIIRHAGLAVSLHIAGAIAVLAAVSRLAWQTRSLPVQDRRVRRLAGGLAAAVIGQIALGIAVLAWHQPVLLATAHVALGALMLGSAWALALWLCPRHPRPTRSSVMSYLELTKPRLTVLAVLTTAAGFVMGSVGSPDWWRLGLTLLGAALIGGGGNALNQWAERDRDALMPRTASRPLPTGRLSPAQAVVFGLLASAAGLWLLTAHTHAAAGLLAAVTLLSYVGLYTPLKRVTSLCTLVGAVPGALPPLIGWAAADGRLTFDAWVLFAILFLWQLPHFLSLAWVYREEYARAGFKMLPVVDPDGASTARQMVLYGLALLPTSLLLTVLHVTGPVYFIGTLGIGVWFLGMTMLTARRRSPALALRSFFASIGYLPLVLALMLLDKTPL